MGKLDENGHIMTVCKIGQGAACCRYLTCGAGGFECGKLNGLKQAIDIRVATMTAKSDNCEGKQGVLT